MSCDTNVPNLDAMNVDELRDISNKLSRPSRKVAAELFPAKPRGYVKAAQRLSFYASNRSAAMYSRRRGNLENATMYEGICERIYKSLPAYAKW